MTPQNIASSEQRPTFASSKLCRSLAAIAAIAAISIGTFQPRNVDAYALEGPKWPNGSTVTMQLSLGNAGRTLSDGNTSWNSAVVPALDNWNAVVARMQFTKVMNSTAAVSSGDRVNSMAFSSTNFGSSFGSNTLAVTTYWFSGSTMVEADILFNSNKSWDSYRGSLRSAFDVQRVALHESGHALGLGHSSLSSAIMYAYVSSAYLLSSDDIAGAQALYGAATATPTPTPTPTPTGTPTPTPTGTATPTPTPGSGAGVMISPAPGSTFSSSSVTFSWTAGSATAYELKVGSSIGSSDIYNSGQINVLSRTVNNIPTDGRTIFVTLWSKVNNSWINNKYTYSASSGSATPTPTPTPTATPTPTPTATPTPTPTGTPSSQPSVSLSASPTSIRRGGTSTFTVTANAPVSSATTVRYSMSGTATLGTNYTLSGTPGQFTIPAGSSSATVTLTCIKIGLSGKTATMTLNSNTTYTLSSPTSASVFMKK